MNMIDTVHQISGLSGKLAFLPTHLLDAADQLVVVHQYCTPDVPLKAECWLKQAVQMLALVNAVSSRRAGPLETATLLEDAAAAALNAVRVSTDENEINRALGLLTHALLRAEATYWARCVVDLLQQQGANISPEWLTIRTSGPTLMLDGLNEPAKAVGFGPWSVHCDTGLTCRAVTFAIAASTPAALLVIRPAGPGAAPRLQIVLSETDPGLSEVQLHIGESRRSRLAWT